VRDRLSGVAGIERVTYSDRLPLGLGGQRRSISIEGYRPAQGEDMEYHFSTVADGYFEALRIPIVRGRAFTSADIDGAPRSVIVNEAFVRRFFPGQDPIGKRIAFGSGDGAFERTGMEIVGVSADGRYVSLSDQIVPYLFYPLAQNYKREVTLVVRTTGDPTALAGIVRSAVREVDPSLPVFSMTTLVEHAATTLAPVRIAAGLLTLMGLLALILAAVGLYGVASFNVGQRTAEIGVRMALGAKPGDILRMVLRQVLTIACVGLAIGLGLAYLATGFMSLLLYGIGPRDVLTFATTVTILLAVTVAATYVPARRAMRVHPLEALRSR
jgi:predicted permease